MSTGQTVASPETPQKHTQIEGALGQLEFAVARMRDIADRIGDTGEPPCEGDNPAESTLLLVLNTTPNRIMVEIEKLDAIRTRLVEQLW